MNGVVLKCSAQKVKDQVQSAGLKTGCEERRTAGGERGAFKMGIACLNKTRTAQMSKKTWSIPSKSEEKTFSASIEAKNVR